jgi:hypothetical protein
MAVTYFINEPILPFKTLAAKDGAAAFNDRYKRKNDGRSRRNNPHK